MEIAKQIGENMKVLRKAKGYTQKEITARLYITQQQYSRFENGVFELNYAQILKLCELLDTTPNEIFGVE